MKFLRYDGNTNGFQHITYETIWTGRTFLILIYELLLVLTRTIYYCCNLSFFLSNRDKLMHCKDTHHFGHNTVGGTSASLPGGSDKGGRVKTKLLSQPAGTSSVLYYTVLSKTCTSVAWWVRARPMTLPNPPPHREWLISMQAGRMNWKEDITEFHPALREGKIVLIWTQWV